MDTSRPRIYALEGTNFCDAKCGYCPREKMTRKLGMCSIETAEKVLNYCREIGQDYIALHHMGEPFLNPNISLIVKMFEAGGVKTEFSTNGFLLKKCGESVLKSGLTRIRIAVDYHYGKGRYNKNLQEFLTLSKNYKTDIRLHTLEGKDLNIFSQNPYAIFDAKKLDNWAGEMNFNSTLDKSKECYFLKYNYVVVLWDGRIVPCCNDFNGNCVSGNIDSIVKMKEHLPCKICVKCSKLQFAIGGEWAK